MVNFCIKETPLPILLPALNTWSSDRLVIQGGSAGGLLMGAVTNMRPELFGIVIAKVPFVDVVNTMLDASIPLTVIEYDEWGNPNEKEFYDYIRSYSESWRSVIGGEWGRYSALSKQSSHLHEIFQLQKFYQKNCLSTIRKR